MRRFGRARAGALAMALMLTLAACGSDGEDRGNDSDARDSIDNTEVDDQRGKSEVEVVMTDNLFTPQNVRVDPGTTIVWPNEGRAAHQLDAFNLDGFGIDFSSNGVIPAGQTFEFTFAEPGTYRYFCKLHGSNTVGMIGAIVVGDGELDAAAVDDGPGTQDADGVLNVPDEYDTIQAAVDATVPGDLVLIAKGTYHEAVEVSPPHDGITIRGEDRNETILDGEFDENKPNGFKVLADGVAIENITAMNFTTNSFFWTGVDGYRGSYLNSYRTGDYGIYAFDSVNGQFDHSWAAGSADAGLYIGQCDPCNALVTDFEAEWNGIGYSGTNSGGNLIIVSSSWHHNRIGIVPNSGTGETLYPQHDTTIVGNLVYSNSNYGTPAISIAELAAGSGILIAGGNDNIVERNRVWDHDDLGIGVIPLPEKVLDPENTNAIDFDATGNVVRDNDVSDSRVADLVSVKNITEPNDSGGNCFEGNTFGTSLPASLETLLPCTGTPAGAFAAAIDALIDVFLSEQPPPVDYREAKLPPMPVNENMPDPLTAPARPATEGVPETVDLASITLPAKP